VKLLQAIPVLCALVFYGCGSSSSSDTLSSAALAPATAAELPADALPLPAGASPVNARYNLRFSGTSSPPFTSAPDSIQQAAFLPANSPQPTAFSAATQNGKGAGSRAFTVQFGRNNTQPLFAGQQLPAASGGSAPFAQVSYTEVGATPQGSRLYVSSSGIVRIAEINTAARTIRLEFLNVELSPRIAAPSPIFLYGDVTYSF
jgi:hypothetical protein